MAAPLIVVLHGPSLSMLGTREPAIYGTATLDDVDALVKKTAGALGYAVRIAQTNHEGALIDAILDARMAAGVVLNAAAYAHTSLAIADAVRAIAPVPVVEVHLTNTAARGRLEAPVGAACAARIEGFGMNGYAMALEGIDRIRQRS